MEETKHHKIIVESGVGDGKIELEVCWDADAEEWLNAFRTIMFWLTFHPDTIREFLPTADELQETETLEEEVEKEL